MYAPRTAVGRFIRGGNIEAGGGRSKILSADETAARMIEPLVQATGVKAGDTALLIINGVGATTLMEMLIVYRKAAQLLAAKGVRVTPGACGEYLTVQEMAGFQMCAAKLDDEMLACWNAPCNTPALTVA